MDATSSVSGRHGATPLTWLKINAAATGRAFKSRLIGLVQWASHNPQIT
jgi:hypothetical protein